MSWLMRFRAGAWRINTFERVRSSAAVLGVERLEALARYAEELAAQQRADKYRTDPDLTHPSTPNKRT